jgi:alpha-tubulin suppressor-like RCC1 family protein
LDSLVIILVVDAGGRPVAATPVRWSVMEGSVAPVSERTSAEGTVAAQWTLGPSLGTQSLRVLPIEGPALTVDAEARAFRAITVATGFDASCALDSIGDAWCWADPAPGWDGTGGRPLFGRIPTKVDSGHTFTQLVGGDLGWCALTAAGKPWCWSFLYQSMTGRPADGTPIWIPAPIQGTQVFTTLGAGQSHMCGVDVSGTGWCWGQSDQGRLGGCCSLAGEPVQVAVPPGVVFAKIIGGREHSCGVTPDGVGYCWGRNNEGELGDTAAPRTSGVFGRVSMPEPIRSIGAGDYHSCAIGISGTTYCWGGQELEGALGLPGVDQVTLPTPVTRGIPGPVTVAWAMNFVIRSGRVVAWGSLSDSPEYTTADPESVSGIPTSIVPELSGVVQVSSQSRSACARLAGGEVYCWGLLPGPDWSPIASAIPEP